MTPDVWARIKALRPAPPRLLHASCCFQAERDALGVETGKKFKVELDGTYKQPDNMRRVKRQAKRDFSARQVRRAIYRQKGWIQ